MPNGAGTLQKTRTEETSQVWKLGYTGDPTGDHVSTGEGTRGNRLVTGGRGTAQVATVITY